MGDSGTTRLRFRVPARGLFGYRSEFLTDTRGEGILHHNFHSWGPWAGPHQRPLAGRARGGPRRAKAVGFALFNLQERGDACSSRRAMPVYGGMIVGENSRGPTTWT